MSPVLRRSTPARTSVRTRLVRRVAPAAALALALGLTGCGTGFKAQTYQQRTTADSTNEAIGPINLRNVFVQPPRSAETYPVGSDARVLLTVVSEDPEEDTLVSVSTDAAASAVITGPNGVPTELVVPGQEIVEDYTIVLEGITRELRPGNYITMEFAFERAGTESFLVPVAVTGTPAPRREGYKPGETDSAGEPIVEEEAENAEEGSDDRPELDTDGGDAPAGDAEVDVESDPIGDNNGGGSAATPAPEG